LPKAGGINEQDGILMDYFSIILNQENIERRIKMNSNNLIAHPRGR
jgi:hypothetical protein